MRVGWALVVLLGAVGVAWGLFARHSRPAPARSAGGVERDAAPGPRLGGRARPASEEGGAERKEGQAPPQALETEPLSPDAMLDLVLQDGLAGEAETTRAQVRARLESGDTDLVGVARRLLELCTSEVAAHRELGGTLLCDALDRRAMLRHALESGMAPAAVPPLDASDLALVTQVLRDERTTGEVRNALLAQLGLLGPGAVTLVPDALRAIEAIWARRARLQEKNPSFHYQWGHADWEVARGMGDIGGAAIPHLTPLLAREGRGLSRMAGIALEQMGEAAVPAVLEAAGSVNPVVRERALEVLGNLGVQTPEIAAALRRALRDEVAEVRSEAAAALVGQGDAAHGDVIRALGHPGRTRRAVLYELAWGGHTGAIPPALHPALLERLEEAREEEHWILPPIADRLGAAAAPATRSLLGVIAANERMSSPTPKELIRALGAEAGPHLLEALRDGDEAVRPWAARGLLWMERVDPDTQRELVAWLQTHPDAPDRVPLAAAAASLGDAHVMGVLLRGLGDGPWDERAAAAVGLGRLGRDATPHLGRLANLLAALARESANRETWWRAWAGLHVAIEGAFHAVGAHDLEALYDLLDHDAHVVRQSALELLLEQTPAATSVALAGWPTASIRARPGTIELIAASTSYDARAWRAIRSAFESDDGAVRIHAASALLMRSDDATERASAADWLVSATWSDATPLRNRARKILTAAWIHGRAEDVAAAVDRGIARATPEAGESLGRLRIELERR